MSGEHSPTTKNKDDAVLVVILSVTITGLVYEYVRRLKLDREKEMLHLERLASMERQYSELQTISSSQSNYISQLEQLWADRRSSSQKK